jgi:hypothetical protein
VGAILACNGGAVKTGPSPESWPPSAIDKASPLWHNAASWRRVLACASHQAGRRLP